MKVCQLCDHVHCSDDASIINRFSPGKKIFIAKHGSIQRDTRAEAENDECAWRVKKMGCRKHGIIKH